MGINSSSDCRRVAELVGIKTFTNEFIAYKELQKLMNNRVTWENYTSLVNITEPGTVRYDDLDINLVQWDVILHKGYLSVSDIVCS